MKKCCKTCDVYSPISVCLKLAKLKEPSDCCEHWNNTYYTLFGKMPPTMDKEE